MPEKTHTADLHDEPRVILNSDGTYRSDIERIMEVLISIDAHLVELLVELLKRSK